MFVKPLEWSDDYNTGVPIVDNAHKGLFQVVRRITSILLENDPVKNRFVCEEAVKYLLDYTVRHFREEETFMLEIGYKGYPMHKHLHDNLREITLPALQKDLDENDYNIESVERLVSIIAGWLTGHIMIEDMAITGKCQSKWKVNDPKEAIQEMNAEFTSFLHRTYSVDAELYNAHYAGETLKNPTCYEMTFKSGDLVIEVVVIAEENLLLYFIEKMLGLTLKQLNKKAIQSFIQVAQEYSSYLLRLMDPQMENNLISHRHLELAELRLSFKESFPAFSLLWKTNKGFIGFCERKKN